MLIYSVQLAVTVGSLKTIKKTIKFLMILYNVTINIHESVHDQWMQWMQEKHIKDVLATGKFSSARMVKVLVEEEMGGTTYSIQYTTDSKETLQKYYDEDAPRLRDEGYRLFGEKMLAFRTELELISEH
jgi:hypothetical protein